MESKITWVDVKNDKPNSSGWYLVTTEGTVSEAYYDKKRKTFIGRDDWELTKSVTAFATMPEPYKLQG